MEYASLALEVRPGNLPALYALGAASSRFGNTDAAAGYYARAANTRPSYPMGHKAAGLYHYYRREMDQTIGYIWLGQAMLFGGGGLAANAGCQSPWRR